jgi:hypothetical protein
MAARNMPDGISHGQDGEPKGKGDADEADAQLGKAGGEDRAAASAEHEPEGAEAFRRHPLPQLHQTLLRPSLPRHDEPPLFPLQGLCGRSHGSCTS